MSELRAVPFDREADDIKTRVEAYWTKRAGSFADIRHDEAHSYKADLWIGELCERLCGSRYLMHSANVRRCRKVECIDLRRQDSPINAIGEPKAKTELSIAADIRIRKDPAHLRGIFDFVSQPLP